MNKFTEHNSRKNIQTIRSKYFGEYQPAIYIASRSKSKSTSKSTEKTKSSNQYNPTKPNRIASEYQTLSGSSFKNKILAKGSQIHFKSDQLDVSQKINKALFTEDSRQITQGKKDDSAIQKIIKWIEQRIFNEKDFSKNRVSKIIYQIYIKKIYQRRQPFSMNKQNMIIKSEKSISVHTKKEQDYQIKYQPYKDLKQHAIDEIEDNQRYKPSSFKDIQFIQNYHSSSIALKSQKSQNHSDSNRKDQLNASAKHVNITQIQTANSLEQTRKDRSTFKQAQKFNEVSLLLEEATSNVKSGAKKSSILRQQDFEISKQSSDVKNQLKNPQISKFYRGYELNQSSRGISFQLNSQSRGVSLQTNSISTGQRIQMLNRSLDSNFSLIKMSIAGLISARVKHTQKPQTQLCDINYWPNQVFHQQTIQQKILPTQIDFIDFYEQTQKQILNQMLDINHDQQYTLKALEQTKSRKQENNHNQNQARINQSKNNFKQKINKNGKAPTAIQDYFSQNLLNCQPQNNEELAMNHQQSPAQDYKYNDKTSQNYESQNPTKAMRPQGMYPFHSRGFNTQKSQPTVSFSQIPVKQNQNSQNAFVKRSFNPFNYCCGYQGQSSSQVRKNNMFSSQNTAADRQRQSSLASNQSKKSSKPKITFNYISPEPKDQFVQNPSLFNSRSGLKLKNSGNRPVRMTNKSPQSKNQDTKIPSNQIILTSVQQNNRQRCFSEQKAYVSVPTQLNTLNKPNNSIKPINEYYTKKTQQSNLKNSYYTVQPTFLGKNKFTHDNNSKMKIMPNYKNPIKIQLQQVNSENIILDNKKRKRVKSCNEKILVTVARSKSPTFFKN